MADHEIFEEANFVLVEGRHASGGAARLQDGGRLERSTDNAVLVPSW
jgi:hypothetical protein